MVCFIYSKDQQTSANIAGVLKELCGFEESGVDGSARIFVSGKDMMLEIGGGITDAGFVDRIVGKDVAVFLSKHSSASGIGAFTVHATGNWNNDALLGGAPKALSVATPANMLSMLRAIDRSSAGLKLTYEATHHGPLTDVPSFFVELGGNEQTTGSVRLAGVLAGAICAFASSEAEEYGKVAVGIGGTHYPEKFTRLALEGRYAFGHIMPKYSIQEDMLQQAVGRSDLRTEIAVIEWKSLNAEQRSGVLRGLEGAGVDYERV